MPERQHTPGEVDERRPEGSGATVTDGSARRTDSPRGDALFAPVVEPASAETTGGVPESRQGGSPAEQATPEADTAAQGTEATTAIPASGAPVKPSPSPRTETATESVAAEGPTGTTPPAAATQAEGTPVTSGDTTASTGPEPTAGAATPPAADADPTGTPPGGTATDGPTVATPATPATAPSPGTRGVTPAPGNPAPLSGAAATPSSAPPAPTPTAPTPTEGDSVADSRSAAAAASAASAAASSSAGAPTAASGSPASSAPASGGPASGGPASGGPAAGSPATGGPASDTAGASAASGLGTTPARSTTPPAGTPAAAPAGSAGTDDQATAVQPAAWSAEDTHVIPRAAASTAADQPTARLGGPADPPTEQIPVTRGGVPPVPPQPQAPSAGGGRKKRKRPLLIVAGVVALLAVLYVADLVLSTGNVPRGVTVAGLQLGGLSKAEASERLRTEIEPRATQPVQVTAGEVRSQIDPRTAGLVVDYQATVDQAGEQPLNPITRITSFFTEREVGVVNTADERSVLTALEQVKPVVDKAPVEGTVRFDGTTPVAVPPVPGQQLDLQAAVGVLERDWAAGAPVALPLIPQPTITTDDDVQEALQSIATPAVSAPVTIQGEGAVATLQPADVAGALTFRADAAATPKLVPEINNEALKEVATPQLASTEKPGRDASLDFSSGAPVVVPSQDGRGVDYDKTFQGLVPVLTAQGPRTLTAVYADQPAKLTTEQLGALGITGEISSFTTGGFAADSGQNIRRAAEQVNGTIVGPGETFSLNALTNPRNAANGYVEAGIIENGHSARGVGGGVSQVATTLYNAAYFAGMVDVEHKEHSFYISRYPVAREATVFDDIIDLKFRNDGPTGVLIQTFWSPSNLTVKMFGTKRYEVTSETGPRTNPTDPQTINLPAGPGCAASKGAPGFTATDTRVMRNVETGEVTRKTRTVRYNPSPIVVCQ